MNAVTKGTILSFKRFEIHDGDGIRTTLFFKGCPLKCKWCHNPESISFRKEMLFDPALCKDCMRCTKLCDANVIRDGKHIFLRDNCVFCRQCEAICPAKAFEPAGIELDAQSIATELLKDEILMKNSGGGVTFSGGEPLMQPELCVEIAKILKTRDVNIAIDTSGAVPRSAIERILPYADTFLFDIKAIDEQVHMHCTGVSNKTILQNIQYVDRVGTPIEIRYPYIPTMNDGEWERIANFIKTLQNVKCVRILPYHNYAERKYICLGQPYPLPDVTVPTKAEVMAVAQKMKECGLTVVETD